MRTPFVLLMLCCAVSIADEELSIKRPFLWTIDASREDAAAVKAHLFGTIHVPDKTITRLHPQAQQAWDDATAPRFEIDFVKDSAAQTKAISLPADQKLEDLIPEPLVQRLELKL